MADLVPDAMINCDINRCETQPQGSAEQNFNEAQELPEHLKKVYEDNLSELSSQEKQQFKNSLIEFSDVFSKNDFDLGCLSGVEHKINTYDEIPHAEKFRRTPLQFQKAEQEYIEKLLQQGVIEPSVSEWSAAPVLVRKKTSKLCYCIDYRALNAKTYKDNFSLPLIDYCMDSLYGKKLFCVLDLCSGYFQIPVEGSSRHKTSFCSFQWTRFAMGLCCAPATFQWAMQLVLRVSPGRKSLCTWMTLLCLEPITKTSLACYARYSSASVLTI